VIDREVARRLEQEQDARDASRVRAFFGCLGEGCMMFPLYLAAGMFLWFK
jgi:hypothetical protein